MYSTKTAVTISMKDLLSMLDDESIYTYYLGKIQIKKLINSPLRNDDKNPSFAIFRGKEGKLFFKDHGTGQGGDSLKFIKTIKGINTKEELEKELLRIVRKTNPNMIIRQALYNQNTSNTVDIGIVRQPFTETDRQYWKQFHISLDTLKKYQVFSIKYYLSNRLVRGIYKDDNPMYAYKVSNGFKIYRPLSSKYTKWRTNLTTKDVQGMSELPKHGGKLLIITKSLKDVMCLYEMGFYAIAASSETTFIPEDIIKSLCCKWKNILILYDRDETGMLEARKYSKQYKFDTFFVHKKFKAKDISDAVKNNGFDVVKHWLNKTLSKYD